MTDAQQVQVLELVTQLGTLVRDQRIEIAQLREDQEKLAQHVDGTIADFGRRITLAEASNAVHAAMAVSTAEPTPTPAPNAPPVVRTAAQTLAPAAASTDTGPHRYHVQAASPGLAMLSELDASGGEERQIPVAPGNIVPGLGKVVTISQQGTSWVVRTEHGLIQ
jgi:hypothetical protein